MTDMMMDAMTQDMIDEMQRTGRDVILKAGGVIRRSFGDASSFAVRCKNPSDFVTSVDLECEAMISGEIARRFPGHHIMAEESAQGGFKPGVTWIIDPLDGTTNFIHGFPFVAISIGVYVDGRIMLGFVYDPIRRELFSAVRGNGAFLNGKPIRVRNGLPLRESLVATGFPFRAKSVIAPYLKSFEQVFQQVSGIRRAGAAALDLAYIAAGRVEGFWEVELKAWDVAAGALLVEEAGGIVSEFHKDGDYLISGNIVAGTDVVYPCLMDAVGAHLSPIM
jgi:myo-inositol-1(or 4)-monophosphatase